MKKRSRLLLFLMCIVLSLSFVLQACDFYSNFIYTDSDEYEVKPTRHRNSDGDRDVDGPTATPYEEYYLDPIEEYDIHDGTEPIQVITSEGFQEGIVAWYRSVYDSCDLHLIPDFKTGVTADMCIDILNKNKKINSKMKELLTDFIRRIEKKYPNSSLDTLYNNLKTLKVVEATPEELIAVTFSIDSLACYQINENTIYIPKGAEFVEGTGDFQILFHEFSHVARSSRWKDKSNPELTVNYVISFQTSVYKHEILEEAMNSVFACSLLNYEERDIAYQVPSNYMRIMLECMDNYTLDDYLNHSDLYFLSKLDEFMGTVNHAETVWKLIVLQRDDWNDWTVRADGELFNPIYDCLCKMYYDKYITPGMSDAEKTAIADELVDKAFYDAVEGYQINPEYFYQYLKENY